MVRQAETEYFMSVASELRDGLRAGKSQVDLADLYDELEGLAFTTDNSALRDRCVLLSDQRGALRDAEITREPFHGDRMAYFPDNWYFLTGYRLGCRKVAEHDDQQYELA